MIIIQNATLPNPQEAAPAFALESIQSGVEMPIFDPFFASRKFHSREDQVKRTR
jgi:hypothetical protein